MQLEKYSPVYCKSTDALQIGCKRFTFEEWKLKYSNKFSFDEYDNGANAWANSYAQLIFNWVELIKGGN